MKTVSFKELSKQRKEVVRAKIRELSGTGLNATEIAKRVRVGYRSVATALGNITRARKIKAKKVTRK